MRTASLGTALAVALLCSTAYGARNLQQYNLLSGLFGGSASPAAAPSPDAGYYYYGDYNENVYECLSTFDLLVAVNETDQDIGTFLQAAAVSGALDLLADPTLSATLFVPTDDAFDEAAAKLNMTLDELLDSPVLLPVLFYHIVPATVLVSALEGEQRLPTLLGQDLLFTPSAANDNSSAGTLQAIESEASIIDNDNCGCQTCPVAVNVIDTVLLPQILSVQGNSSFATIILGDGSGQPSQKFVIEYGSLAPSAAPAAGPAAAPANSPATSTGSAVAAPPVAVTRYPASGPEVPLMSLGSGSLRGSGTTTGPNIG